MDGDVAKDIFVGAEYQLSSNAALNASFDAITNVTYNVKELSKHKNRILRGLVITAGLIFIFLMLPILVTGLLIKPTSKELMNVFAAGITLLIMFSVKRVAKM